MDHSNKYLYFMIALAVSLFMTTLGKSWANVSAALLFLFSLITAVWFLTKSKRRRAFMLALSVLAVVPLWELLIHNQKANETIIDTLWLCVTLYVGVLIFRNINRAKIISTNQIYGVISVYLLIGVFFGLIFQILLAFDPNAFAFNPANFKNAIPNEGDVYYYSFITLSTVGYGDVSPVAPIARSVSVIEAIVGIMYVATMIARFVAGHSAKEA